MKKRGRNPVAKHARKFNKATVHQDRKKAEKRGERGFSKSLVDALNWIKDL